MLVTTSTLRRPPDVVGDSLSDLLDVRMGNARRCHQHTLEPSPLVSPPALAYTLDKFGSSEEESDAQLVRESLGATTSTEPVPQGDHKPSDPYMDKDSQEETHATQRNTTLGTTYTYRPDRTLDDICPGSGGTGRFPAPFMRRRW